MSQKPRTAKEAVAHFQTIYDELPQDEKERLAFVAVADGEDVGPIDFLAGILRFMVALPEEFRRVLLVMTIEAMTPAERRRWIRYCEQPGAYGESDARNILLSALRRSAEPSAKDAQKDRAFHAALHSYSPAVRARIDTAGKRVEMIDALLDENYLRSEIYGQMCLKHDELISGIRTRYPDEVVAEKQMWECYKAAGGCHPKAIRPKGRPPKK
jgi:hypothetical protein